MSEKEENKAQEQSKPKAQEQALPLVEGKDYYIENGRWVFTTEYHVKRGYCCGSGCRHCPYSDKKQP